MARLAGRQRLRTTSVEHEDSPYYPASLETGGLLYSAETSFDMQQVNKVTLVVVNFRFSLNLPYYTELAPGVVQIPKDVVQYL